MNVFTTIFRRKQLSRNITQELRKREVQQVISGFIGNHAKRTDGIILIWASNGELYLDAGGIDTEAEALGILSLCDSMIKTKGLPAK